MDLQSRLGRMILDRWPNHSEILWTNLFMKWKQDLTIFHVSSLVFIC